MPGGAKISKEEKKKFLTSKRECRCWAGKQKKRSSPKSKGRAAQVLASKLLHNTPGICDEQKKALKFGIIFKHFFCSWTNSRGVVHDPCFLQHPGSQTDCDNLAQGDYFSKT